MQFYVFNGYPGVPKTRTSETFTNKERAIQYFRSMVRDEPLDAWTVIQTDSYECTAVETYQPPRTCGHQLLLNI